MGYCERCGGKYDFEGLCDGCGTDEEWSWNTPKNQNKVVCEGCDHEIYEVRRYCHVCGTRNLNAFKRGEHYCPDCGNAFENGICPNCGRTYDYFANRKIEQIDLRYCAECGTETSRNDCFCINCGNPNYINDPLKEPVKPIKKPARSVVLPKETAPKNFYDELDYSDDDEYTSVKVNTNLWIILGVLSTLFCCFISGIVTTVFALKAKNAQKKGKFATAVDYVDKAEGWLALSVIIGVIQIVAGIIVSLILK